MLRITIGMVLLFGASGLLDTPDSSLSTAVVVGLVGSALVLWGGLSDNSSIRRW